MPGEPMPGAYAFPRRCRLNSAREISEVFDNNTKYHSAHFLILARPNGLGFTRIAIMVPKKIEKSSPRRNYMRRVAREYLRQHSSVSAGLDLIFKTKAAFNFSDRAAIFGELDNIFRKLPKCLAS